ncbi:hypothetical protein B0T17DRAFT_620950 [Bombardia bombarda]|uniref:SPIN90/Ldb17 leucine-rich domain-containing protein n=1 Tax=Bombardia bombarda TaxID=252184 RepID=A0AA39TKE7_9PEZI|nr:hypothetical protein B0T17DRAFT_620950 [Bombardia bombarda]
MAEHDVTDAAPFENEQQFWQALNDTLSSPCATYEELDDALRAWLGLVSKERDRYLDDENEIATCSQKLRDSPIFCTRENYVRTQIIHSLLQEDGFGYIHGIANFLLLDGRAEEDTFRKMVSEGCFGRLIELIKSCGQQDRRLHRLLLQLLYEMSRIECLRLDDMIQVDDGFVTYLFQLIESLCDDVDDPYHYPVIRVLLVLNEQYMIASTSSAVDATSPSTAALTNRVVKVLSVHGPSFRTFGENIILLLNRAAETAEQLLILKLLYLLFTTKATYDYFYVNDLRVLLDVIIRNLLDLPSEMNNLRHTYLRVLAPLLAHTQLSHPPHYKREQILSLLDILRGSGSVHFNAPEPTTLRLVERVAKTPWLLIRDDEVEPEAKSSPPLAKKYLLGSLTQAQSASTVSVVANVMEKPGVKTPSRKLEIATSDTAKDEEQQQERQEHEKDPAPWAPQQPRTLRAHKSLPEVPKHRHGVPMVRLPQNNHNTDVTTTPTSPLMNGHGDGTTPPQPPPTRRSPPKVPPLPRKMPPKLPPPRRRTKLRTASGAAEVMAMDVAAAAAAVEAISLSPAGTTPVS